MSSATIILLLLAIWIIQSLREIFSQKGFGIKSILSIVGSLFMIIGAIGFFGLALASTGGLKDVIPNSFELPIGEARAIIEEDGTTIVAHEPSSRIQIYDGDLNFKRGWFIDAGGGMFSIDLISKDKIHIHTTRGNHDYVYNIDGTLLPNSSKESNGTVKFQEKDIKIPTPCCLSFLTSPITDWFIGAFGMFLVSIGRKK